jgi:antitoxin PrlF
MNEEHVAARRTSTVSEKGQITIPQALRYRMNIKPGEVLELWEESGRLVIQRSRHHDPLDDIYGILEIDRSVDAFIDELRGPCA